MKQKILFGLTAIILTVLFTSCPLVYPGGGTITFVGTNELGPAYTVGDFKISLTGDSNGESYSATGRFGSTATSFSSLSLVEAGNYFVRITVYDGFADFLVDNSDGFWLSEGEQKQVNFTLYDDGSGPKLSFDSITSDGGASNFWVEQSGAGVVWRGDFYQVNPSFQMFHQIGAWGNLQNLMKASVRYPDGNGVDFTPGGRNINVSVSYGHDGNSIGFNRPDYAEYGFYSWEFTSFSGEKVSGEVLLNPTWTSDNVANINSWSITSLQADLSWIHPITDGVDTLLGLVIHRGYRQIMGAEFFLPSLVNGSIPAYDQAGGYPTMSDYDIILLTLDAPVTQEQLDTLWEVSADDIATRILMLPDGPGQVGVHVMEFYY